MDIRTLILKNLKKCKKLFILFCITFILTCIILPLETWLISRLVGCFEIKNSTEALNQCFTVLLILVGYYLIRALINGYYATYIKEAFSQTFLSHLVTDIFTKIHAHSVRYFDDEMSGRVSSALTGLCQSLTQLFTDTCFLLIRPIGILIISYSIIATFSPSLSALLFAINIPYFFAIYKVNRHFFDLGRNRVNYENIARGILVDSIANANLVKYSGSFFSEQLYFYKSLKQALLRIAEQGRYQIVSRFAFHAIDTVFLTSGIFLILYFAQKDNIALDNLFYVYTTLVNLVLATMGINNYCQFISDQLGGIRANFSTLNQPIDIKEKEDAINIRPTKAEITFKDVNFSYIEGKPIFKNLNLHIKAREKIGIVGHSGSGKSTLINLLLRAYDVDSGEILLNKTNIKDLTFRSHHKNIAVISQDTALFNRSILENLRITNSQASEEQIRQAAQLAQIDKTIMNLPHGYNSVVGERGTMLSGGERQRIAIARAILQNAPILILDEATSALDSEAEIMIEKALQNIIKDKTVIAIAHRLSTLRSMDRIIVLENGKIIEEGSIDELLKNKSGTFYKLYQLQNNGYLSYGEEA